MEIGDGKITQSMRQRELQKTAWDIDMEEGWKNGAVGESAHGIREPEHISR